MRVVFLPAADHGVLGRTSSTELHTAPAVAAASSVAREYRAFAARVKTTTGEDTRGGTATPADDVAVARSTAALRSMSLATDSEIAVAYGNMTAL